MARKPTDQVHLKLRFTERLRKQIEQAAAHNNRSMNEEIIRRLEESFTMGDLTKTLVKTVEKTIQATITSSGAGYTPSTGYPPHPVKPENS
jgi:Arc-like DNA binding domain